MKIKLFLVTLLVGLISCNFSFAILSKRILFMKRTKGLLIALGGNALHVDEKNCTNQREEMKIAQLKQISGGSRGIGRATALAFARAGASKIYVADFLSAEEAAELDGWVWYRSS